MPRLCTIITSSSLLTQHECSSSISFIVRLRMYGCDAVILSGKCDINALISSHIPSPHRFSVDSFFGWFACSFRWKLFFLLGRNEQTVWLLHNCWCVYFQRIAYISMCVCHTQTLPNDPRPVCSAHADCILPTSLWIPCITNAIFDQFSLSLPPSVHFTLHRNPLFAPI